MIYALVHYPQVEMQRIQQFRQKYDPQTGLIAPHVTLMFPVPESVGENRLVRHLERVLQGWQPFEIHLQQVQISLDNYVYLLIQEGKEKIIRLHDEIYTDVLREFLREDIPFIPHLTLGVVDTDDRILEEAEQLEINEHCRLDQVRLVKVNDDRTKIVWSRNFQLAGG